MCGQGQVAASFPGAHACREALCSLWLAQRGMVGVFPTLPPPAAQFPTLETLEAAVISPSGLALSYPDPSPAQGAQLTPPHPSAPVSSLPQAQTVPLTQP